MGIFPRRDKLKTLEEAARMINDGDTIICGGEFQARAPVGMIRELIRQKKKNLRIVGHASGIIMDLACGGGIVKELALTRTSFEREFGGAPNYRRAIEEKRVGQKDACCGIFNQQLRASWFGLPWMPLNPHVQYTDYLKLHPEWKLVDDPYNPNGEKIVLVPKLRPNVTLLHANKGDTAGNFMIEHKEYYDLLYSHASEKTIVTVDDLVTPEEMGGKGEGLNMCPRLSPSFPYFKVAAIVHLPFGAHPASCYPKYTYDSEHIEEYLEYARASSDKFQEYLGKYVYGCRTNEEYLEKVGGVARIQNLTSWRNRLIHFPFMRESQEASIKEYTIDELMVVYLSRLIENLDVCVHGGDSMLPMAAIRLAKLMHAPDAVFFGGLTGAVNPEPPILPSNTNDIWYFYNAEIYYPFDYLFDLWENREIDVMFFSGAQIDKYGNVNATLIGSIDNIKTKLPGGGGTCNVMGTCKKTIIWTTRHQRPKETGHYVLVDKVDFITGHGNLPPPIETNEIGPYKCITDLGIFSFDKEKRIMKLEALYPDTTVDDILKNTEFKPIIPEKVPTVTPPTRKEIDILRRIADPSGVRRMEFRPEQLKRSFLI